MDTCDDCNARLCRTCDTHHCLDPCPCDRYHTCDCQCRAYDQWLTDAD